VLWFFYRYPRCLSYRHLQQEVILTEAEAQVSAGGGAGGGAYQVRGAEHKDQVKVTWERSLEEGKIMS
jgi:hypothetical protein